MWSDDPSEAPAGRDIGSILEENDAYIRSLARKTLLNVVPLDVRDLEIDEIAQNTRFKLFMALSKPDQKIGNLKPYIRSIAHHEAVNVIRKYRHYSPITVDEYCEIMQGEILIRPAQGMQDPALELEWKEEIEEAAADLVSDILTLPTRQRYAVVRMLRDTIQDIQPLEEAFLNLGLSLESTHHADEAKEIQRLRALLYIARKKLRLRKVRKNSLLEKS